MWQIPALMPLFFMMVRAWAWSERLAQRTPLWPDGLRWMAGSAMLGATGDIVEVPQH